MKTKTVITTLLFWCLTLSMGIASSAMLSSPQRNKLTTDIRSQLMITIHNKVPNIKIVLPSSNLLQLLYGKAATLPSMKITHWHSDYQTGYCIHFNFTPQCLGQSVCSNGSYCQQTLVKNNSSTLTRTIDTTREGTFGQLNHVEWKNRHYHFIITSKADLKIIKTVIKKTKHRTSNKH